MKRLLVLFCGLLAAAGPVWGFYGSDSDVKSVSSVQELKALLKKDGPALLELYAPWCGHCKALTPEWGRAAAALKGMLTVAAVDADANKDVAAEMNVRGYPTIKFVHLDASGSLRATDYSGGRSARELVQWALQQAQAVALGRLGVQAGAGAGAGGRAGGGGGSCGGGGGGGGGGGESFYAGTEVVTLTDGNFHKQVGDSDEMWFVEFYAPWCGHCRNLKPAWIDLAKQLGGKVRVGAVDCTQEKATCSEFGVQGFPTLKFFGSNKERPEDYNGGRDTGSLAAFATERWAAQQPPPEVHELVDEQTWEEHCVGHAADVSLDLKEVKPKQLCLVAFLPHILDSKAAGRRAYLQILKDLTSKYKDRPFSYLWAQGGVQPELEANFGVGGYGYPALVAFNPGKAKYGHLRSAFEGKSVKQFIESVRLGFEPVSDVAGSLAKVRTADAWDGGEGQAEAADEFDLADLMGDDEGGKKEEL